MTRSSTTTTRETSSPSDQPRLSASDLRSLAELLDTLADLRGIYVGDPDGMTVRVDDGEGGVDVLVSHRVDEETGLAEFFLSGVA